VYKDLINSYFWRAKGVITSGEFYKLSQKHPSLVTPAPGASVTKEDFRDKFWKED
jgi:hypothetical protein